MRIALQPRRRAGFTLIELLVVIAIIGVLTAMGAGAYFKYSAASRVQATSMNLERIQGALDQQVKGLLNQLKGENPDAATVTATQNAALINNTPLARALWLKLRLRQEFPVSFAEANAFAPTAFSAVNGVTAGTAEEQSAVCLFLILSKSRNGAGAGVKPEELGNTTNLVLGGKSFKVFVDSWGQPIAFSRWTNDNNILSELNNPPYGQPGVDSQDPDKLLNTAWPSRNTYEASLHPFDNQNRIPFVYSAGPNKGYGNSDDVLAFRIRAGNRGN